MNSCLCAMGSASAGMVGQERWVSSPAGYAVHMAGTGLGHKMALVGIR